MSEILLINRRVGVWLPSPEWDMTTHSQSDLQFEIGHVLFIDIVGYSKLLIDQQRERIRELKEIVRGTEQFHRAEAEGKLLRLPTGDGGALVFRNTQEAPVLCALEISKALKNYPELLKWTSLFDGFRHRFIRMRIAQKLRRIHRANSSSSVESPIQVPETQSASHQPRTTKRFSVNTIEQQWAC
jgi:hypothetical protein